MGAAPGNPPKGFGGHVLRVNLKTGTCERTPLDPAFARAWLGGRGFVCKVLYDEVPRDADPLGPLNRLVVSPGVMSGNFAPTGSKCCFGAVSPLTGAHGDSTVGGHFGPELKFAGYDLVVFEEIAEKPVYLFVEDEKVELRDASKYWGKGTIEAEEMLKNDLGEDFEVAVIGPAGESMVSFACVGHDYGRQAGRCGVGAVMGSKKLKAIAVRGTRSVPIHDLPALKDLTMGVIKRTSTHPNMAPWQKFGTSMFVGWSNEHGVYPTHNFQTTYFERYAGIDGQPLVDKLLVSNKACFGCWMNCGKYARVTLPEKPQVHVEGPEYETGSLCGGNCGFDKIEEVAYVNWVCDQAGIDTMSGGGFVAFGMECYEKGLITKEQLEGRELRWGSVDDFEHFVDMIVNRRGIGDWFARGIVYAAGQIGHDSIRFTAQVKGQGMSGYDGRGAPAMLLSYMTADIGAHHNRAWTITMDEDLGKDVIRGKAKVVVYLQHIRPFFDVASCCRLLWGEVDVTPEEHVESIRHMTGWSDFSLEEAMRLSDRLWNLNRAHFLERNGGPGRKHDYPPARFYEEAVPSGPGKGARLTLDDLDVMLDEYYAARGWSREGNPSREVLEDLGLPDTAARLEGLGLLGTLMAPLPEVRGERYKPKAF
ncbi:MAG: aldehyde ferredoxin oxidoreductase [Acidobacteria bacterium]|nr:MAG: aldehyde ferredoxin oxidoreductase [Acidobacteriota bacterium]MCE7956885.1 aldehyde ferredoxin oxidoreductase [Acidobacteria bacterium ACB2]